MSNETPSSIGPCEVCGIHFPWHSTHPDCKGAKAKAFHTATYYTCNDEGGELSHDNWTEAIEEFVDGWHDPQPPPNRPIDEIIADIAPLTVFGWVRKTLPTSFGFGEAAIDTMLEDFEEMYWCDEYGEPFESGSPPWDDELLREVKGKLYATMEECLSKAHIWQCEQTCQMEFGKEELTAILKEHSPHWWKDNE